LPKRNPALCRFRVGFDTKAENAPGGSAVRGEAGAGGILLGG